jgi:hypothetical protein
VQIVRIDDLRARRAALTFAPGALQPERIPAFVASDDSAAPRKLFRMEYPRVGPVLARQC